MEIHWELDEVEPSARLAVERQLRALAREHADLIDVRIAVAPRDAPRCVQREVRITSLARSGQITVALACHELAQGLKLAIEATERELRGLRERMGRRPSAAF
jgi:ribosome-associated translation inhibitor RaiA